MCEHQIDKPLTLFTAPSGAPSKVSDGEGEYRIWGYVQSEILRSKKIPLPQRTVISPPSLVIKITHKNGGLSPLNPSLSPSKYYMIYITFLGEQFIL